jgi:hypothetical protein
MSEHASSSTTTQAATQIAQNGVFERAARAGYVVSGLLHLTIGYLAIRIAFGSGGDSADQSGALAAVAAKPGGILALWVAAVAFLVMGLWRLHRNSPRPVDRPEIPGRTVGSPGSGQGLRTGGGLSWACLLRVRIRPGCRPVCR